ncbi:MAG: phytanoyl-CoA dioxygenase family protein [Thermodesulfobacteriota bacterium]
MTPLPSLDEPYVLASDAVEGYRRDGFAIVRGLASPEEIASFRPAIADAARRFNRERRPLAERDTYGKAFLQTINLWRRDGTARRFVFARRFARVAAELMGVAGVRLYHDQALFKEAGGAHTPWHQDQWYWPLDTRHTVTMWMALGDLAPDMGIMHFARGSHAHGQISELPIGDASEEELAHVVAQRGFEVVSAGSMRAGDATFHSGWTLHGAPPNRSAVTREAMTVIYFADGTRVLAPDNPGRAFDLRWWLPGLAPGDLAASPDNALLYSNEGTLSPRPIGQSPTGPHSPARSARPRASRADS